MEKLESALEKACKDGILPGVVLQAANKSGSFKYSKAIGSLSLEEGKTGLPLAVDSVFVIASCAKLMTSIAALQCVERGQVRLDEDLANILPEIAKLEVITGFDDKGAPQLKKRQNPITLSHLLTHSSGLAYPGVDPELQKYITYCDDPNLVTGGTVASRYAVTPLIFEPGTNWMYGSGIDWAGKVVERLNDNISLEDYMKKHIWGPLGIKDITFEIWNRPDMRDRRVGMTITGGDGKVHHTRESAASDGLEECFGGQGAFATMTDYLKVMQSILANDEKLLKRDTVAQMISPQLGKEAKSAFDSLRPGPSIFNAFIGEFPDDLLLDYGLGSMVTMSEDPGWRGKGTLIWGGLPNISWFIDQKHGVCGIFGTQVFPPGNAEINKLVTLFEKTMQQVAKES